MKKNEEKNKIKEIEKRESNEQGGVQDIYVYTYTMYIYVCRNIMGESEEKKCIYVWE